MTVPISTFDLFKIGIGPSSSHTVGPMKAAKRFTLGLQEKKVLDKVKRVEVELYGSLALTGHGHRTDKAVILGLHGHEPETIDPDAIEGILEKTAKLSALMLDGKHEISFSEKKHIIFFRRKSLPLHPNGLIFKAWDENEVLLHDRTYYSVGGGFVVNQETAEQDELKRDKTSVPFPFSSADELLAICEREGMDIWQVVMKNEEVWRPVAKVRSELDRIYSVMMESIDRGCRKEGYLPGKLKVKRRAPTVFKELVGEAEGAAKDPLTVLDWVNLYALAVNEENASGSQVVTAPTNGAAGIVPAVMRYFERFILRSSREGIHEYLLTAAAIGVLYKINASISGAEVGCQGEVGVACSMAAGGLVAALGGTPKQVEQAAEIGMEHNLGLTCDPIGGLVQIPCIERNAMGAVKAINAARIAMKGDGNHFVSLDSVIKTMRQTGADMKTKYKETSRGGLAVNVIEC